MYVMNGQEEINSHLTVHLKISARSHAELMRSAEIDLYMGIFFIDLPESFATTR